MIPVMMTPTKKKRASVARLHWSIGSIRGPSPLVAQVATARLAAVDAALQGNIDLSQQPPEPGNCP